jgi:hypothetical protein
VPAPRRTTTIADARHGACCPLTADAAPIHLLPTLWFRNTWSWAPRDPRPRLSRIDGDHLIVRTEHHQLPPYHLHAEPGGELLFCDNESNEE